MKNQRQRNNNFKVLKEIKTVRTLAFKKKSKIKTFANKIKLREFITSRTALQKNEEIHQKLIKLL